MKDKSSIVWAQGLMPVIPALWEAKVRGLLETSLGNMEKPYLYKRYKNQPAWVPAVPAIGEAEAGASLEPRRLRLQ